MTKLDGASLRSFLRQKLASDEARQFVRERVERRSESLLAMMERGLFSHAASPYVPLMKLAGCEPGDIKNLLARQDIETTLRGLLEAGVFLTLDEFRGRVPVIRQGREISLQGRDFRNPTLKEARGGKDSFAAMPLDHMADASALWLATLEAHGCADYPAAAWDGFHPDVSGLNAVLRSLKAGRPIQKWFTLEDNNRNPWPPSVSLMNRLQGSRLPRPLTVPLDKTAIIASWLTKHGGHQGNRVLMTTPSRALRLLRQARQDRLDLDGTVFILGGESITPALSDVAGAGVRVIPYLYFGDFAPIGYGCADPRSGDDLHLALDGAAVINHPRPVAGMCGDVDALYLTTLQITAPFILLNIETGDAGDVESRSCGCALGKLGLAKHLRRRRPFARITCEGVDVSCAELEQILDDVLPVACGGSAGDYRLREEESGDGQRRIVLEVNPETAVVEDRLRETFLAELERRSQAARLAARVWRSAGSLVVSKRPPRGSNRVRVWPLEIPDVA